MHPNLNLNFSELELFQLMSVCFEKVRFVFCTNAVMFHFCTSRLHYNLKCIVCESCTYLSLIAMTISYVLCILAAVVGGWVSYSLSSSLLHMRSNK